MSSHGTSELNIETRTRARKRQRNIREGDTETEADREEDRLWGRKRQQEMQQIPSSPSICPFIQLISGHVQPTGCHFMVQDHCPESVFPRFVPLSTGVLSGVVRPNPRSVFPHQAPRRTQRSKPQHG